ncbi:MAG: PEP-utilizing enzyme [Patescibacteria group bacterium]
MTLKKTLVQLKRLMDKWGLCVNDWFLFLHYSDMLQGFNIQYGRDSHLHIVIDPSKIPWAIKKNNSLDETITPAGSSFEKDFNNFIKKTYHDFHIKVVKPIFFRTIKDNHSIMYRIGKNKIRISTTIGNLMYAQQVMPIWKKQFSADIIARRFIWFEALYLEAKRRGKKEIVKMTRNLIKKYKPKDIYKVVNETIKSQSFDNGLVSGETGCGGHASGKVLYIRNPDIIPYKLHFGMILVSKLISPKLISQVKKSKAVVTDEGGKLSHAAILCREFNIPCVIGTKIATKVLKDGDRVEVDATRGIVKKL